MGGKIVEDVVKKANIGVVADTNSKRRKGRKKDKVEIMISVGGKRREVLSTEEGAERGKGELVGGREEEGRICQDCRRKGMVASKERGKKKKTEQAVREKEGSMMLNLNLPVTPTLLQPDPPKWEAARSEEDWSLQEERIVKNLRFSLDQLRVVGDEASYMDLVEKLVIGPAPLRATHMEQLLGINPDLVSRASSSSTSTSTSRPRERRGKRGESREGAKSEDSELRRGNTRVDLLDQFQMFSKFGESGSDGSQITLTQSDKWLRQAKVIDGWNVTTTDTAIAFRKISRGSIRLSYSSWRKFLEELSDRGELSVMEVGQSKHVRLETCVRSVT